MVHGRQFWSEHRQFSDFCTVIKNYKISVKSLYAWFRGWSHSLNWNVFSSSIDSFLLALRMTLYPLRSSVRWNNILQSGEHAERSIRFVFICQDGVTTGRKWNSNQKGKEERMWEFTHLFLPVGCPQVCMSPCRRPGLVWRRRAQKPPQPLQVAGVAHRSVKPPLEKREKWKIKCHALK